MCSRFYYDDGVFDELGVSYDREELNVKNGDIHPADLSAVITSSDDDTLMAKPMRWGFRSLKDRKKIHINARAESALSRVTFSDSILNRRCIIPAGHFYEWDAGKNMVTFRREGIPVLMAGCFITYEDGDHFVILTTKANEYMKPIHDRMPLILEPGEMKVWMNDSGFAEMLLKNCAVELSLERAMQYEQLSLF